MNMNLPGCRQLTVMLKFLSLRAISKDDKMFAYLVFPYKSPGGQKPTGLICRSFNGFIKDKV